jgi:hypothetical protein
MSGHHSLCMLPSITQEVASKFQTEIYQTLLAVGEASAKSWHFYTPTRDLLSTIAINRFHFYPQSHLGARPLAVREDIKKF